MPTHVAPRTRLNALPWRHPAHVCSPGTDALAHVLPRSNCHLAPTQYRVKHGCRNCFGSGSWEVRARTGRTLTGGRCTRQRHLQHVACDKSSATYKPCCAMDIAKNMCAIEPCFRLSACLGVADRHLGARVLNSNVNMAAPNLGIGSNGSGSRGTSGGNSSSGENKTGLLEELRSRSTQRTAENGE